MLSALLTPVIVPPVNLLVLALLSLLLRQWRLSALLMVVLLLLATPLASGALTSDLERGLKSADPFAAQAILILGGDLDRDEAGKVVPGSLTLERLREGAILARATRLPVAVTGGPAWQGGPPVGIVMARSLREDFGVEVRWVESRSLDTWENARDSADLLRPDGVRTVLVVTHAWHMRRSLLAFRQSGLVAIPSPVWRRGYPSSSLLAALTPRATTWQDSYFALHEWIGLGWYALHERLSP